MSSPVRCFQFRLALQLGCTRRELLKRLDSHELAEWMAYYAIEPFGSKAADLRASISSVTMINMYKKKGATAAQYSDFMPIFRKDLTAPPKKQSAEVMKKLLMGMVSKNVRINR